MTKDEIDELMRENGIVVVGEAVYALCNLAAAAEREECAKAAEAVVPRHTECGNKIAGAIRARSNHD